MSEPKTTPPSAPASGPPPTPPATPPRVAPELTERAFSRRMAIWLAVAGALSLLATLVLPLLGGDAPDRTTRAPNAYSKSAVGHHALVSMLRELGLPVLVSRYHSAARARADQPLVIAEPTARGDEELVEMMVEALGNGAPVVVVLPKWDPYDWDPPQLDDELGDDVGPLPLESQTDPSERAPKLLPLEDVVRPLNLINRAVARYAGRAVPEEWPADIVTRDEVVDGWDGDLARFGTPSLARFQGVDLTLGPELAAHGPQGAGSILIGSWPGREAAIYVVTDPELFDTMGLGRGDNAVLTYRFFVDRLGARGLVFDEVVHGFKKPPSIWSDLFDFPLIVLTFHLIGLLALGLWAAGARFGKPDRLPPRIAPGKATLISNTATLLAVGGHVGYGLREYFKSTLRAVARDCAVPTRLDDDERLKTLARLAADRGIAEDPLALSRRVAQVADSKREGRRALALARRIYRFRMEMTNGHHRD